jgi:polar amino acid transport system permease protein
MMRRIILPQALRIIIPSIGNFFVSIFKDSALVSVLTLRDLMFSGQLLASSTFKHFEIFAMVAVIYFLISYPVAKFVEYIEARFDVRRRRPVAKRQTRPQKLPTEMPQAAR